ncbi:MAG: c-type cytochrome biogenesis protein CcmI [Parvularculaceae bacterium]
MSGTVFLVASAGIAVVALVSVALPLLRKREGGGHADGERDDAAAALRRQLAGIARDRDSGLIDADAAIEAELEAKRTAIGAVAAPLTGDASARRLRFSAIAFLALAPVVAAAAYLSVGAPALLDPPPGAAAPTDIAALPEDERRAAIEQMVASLAARLESEPGDAAGWRMLARSELVLERAAESATSYRRLFMLDAGTLDDWRNYATALAAIAPQTRFPADPEFLTALGEIEKRAPDDMMALFYRGGAMRETGDPAGAASIWRRLLAMMPADAPVKGTLEDLIAEADAAALNTAVPK